MPATCPAGKTRVSWTPAIDNRKNAVIKVKVSSKGSFAQPPKKVYFTVTPSGPT